MIDLLGKVLKDIFSIDNALVVKLKKKKRIRKDQFTKEGKIVKLLKD